MDNLQYVNPGPYKAAGLWRFKPYYKWIIFNIQIVSRKWSFS